jgi:hypothetical protein
LGAAGEAADHHGVHDGHADPTYFGEDEGEGQVESGAELGAQGGPGEHGGIGQFTGEEVSKERRKEGLEKGSIQIGSRA